MSRLLVLLFLTAVCSCPSALRLRPDPEHPAAHITDNTSVDVGEDQVDLQAARHLPPLLHYTYMWKARYNAEEPRIKEPMSAGIKLILGVFTIPNNKAYRDVIRSTWLQQTGVCYWSTEPQDGCSVYVAFVLGKAQDNSAETRAAYKEQGVFEVDIKENMNGGKSPIWMKAAVEKFPWATHYGKMDMDTYPFLHKLVARMGTNRSCVEGYSEYEWIGRPADWNIERSGPFAQACPYKSCMGWYSTSPLDYVGVKDPFHFMAGELYVLSRPLAAGIPWARRGGNEDITMSNFVAEFSREQGKCVVLRKLDSDTHLGRPLYWDRVEISGVVNEDYATDYQEKHQKRRG